MKKIHGFSLLVIALAAIWALAFVADARAQSKGGKKDAGDKGKKNEQSMKNDSKGSKATYKPHGMNEKDMAEWTDGNPPGWSHGEKTGWGGAGAPPGQVKEHGEHELIHVLPPGSGSWDNKTRENWLGRLEQSRTRAIDRIVTRDGKSRENEQGVIVSIEGAARAGVPIEHTEAIVNRTIDGGMQGRDIEKVTRAVAYGADRNTDYNRLNRLVDRRMKEGETGDALALSIYKEVDEQHAGKPEEPVKKSWWSRIFGG